MRPLTLAMTAFGPFPGTETIRFTDLGENPLFLINGPTGSGKTTILDAICFALYGKTTSDEREGTQMRCDLAAAETLTEVTLEFEICGRRFRIRRLPEQQRSKSRGEGTTAQAPEAQLIELLADGGERLIVASKVTEATREVEELTGLSVDQFRQVMVLPQGKFRQLLMVDSSERERIFSQLFQTRIYKRLEESLKAQSAEIRRQRERQQQLQQGILEGADLASAEELEREMSELGPSVKTAWAEKAATELAFLAAGKAHEQARAIHEDFERLAKVTTELETLQQRSAEINAGRQRLQLADKALRLKPLFVERQRCALELTQAQKAVEQATTRQQTADKALADATLQQSEVKSLQGGLDQAKQQAAQLDGYRARTDRLAAARQAWQRAATEVVEAELQLQFKILADHYLALHELEQLGKEVQRQQSQLQKAKDHETQLRQRCDKLERGAKVLELAWHQGQAAILATELRTGEPCPVCGSCDHPAPATTDLPLPNQRQVEESRQAVQQAYKELESARDRSAREQEDLRELQQKEHKYRHDIETNTPKSLPELKQLINTLKEKAETLGIVLLDRRQILAVDRQHLQEVSQCKKNDVVAAKAKAETAEQELPETYREPGTLEQALQTIRTQIAEWERSIRTSQEVHLQAERQAEAARVAAELATTRWQEVQSALETAQQAAEAALGASPFADEQKYLDALLDDAGYAAQQQQIADFDSTSQRLDGVRAQLQEQLQGKERPDLEQIEERLQSTEAKKNQATDRWLELDHRLRLLERTRQKLLQAAATLAELDCKYAIVGTVSDVASGQTGNKISLQRFVLSVLLDDVLIEASHRLSLMSRGRYQLLRKEDRAKGNKASGLELEVEDAYTGKIRSVATLSGGESFMAALSLALGLSDVVQAYAGGIRLDTLFIDEGFGSLDSESLDLAVRTLIDLQATGRMVGVISHVAELKEQMPLRLDVLAGRDGSHISLVVP